MRSGLRVGADGRLSAGRRLDNPRAHGDCQVSCGREALVACHRCSHERGCPGGPMPKPRRLMVADALTLTAAIAVGIAGTRHVWKWCGYPWFWGLDEGWSVAATIRRLTVLVVILLPGLAVGTVAVLVARFTPPRPSRRRIALQPGSAACGVALLVMIVEALG